LGGAGELFQAQFGDFRESAVGTVTRQVIHEVGGVAAVSNSTPVLGFRLQHVAGRRGCWPGWRTRGWRGAWRKRLVSGRFRLSDGRRTGGCPLRVHHTIDSKE